MTGAEPFPRVASVRFERVVPGPIERVWDVLARPERLPAWFGEGTIEPRDGGAVRLMGGHIRGVVTQWRPPRRLAYSWNVDSPGETESAYPESYLTLELSERDGEVLLVLTHLPVLERFEKQNAMGWATFLDLVEDALRGRPAASREAHMTRNAERFGVDLQNLAR
jgi:uncharacterized protein YndB with AHSA1/START domain